MASTCESGQTERPEAWNQLLWSVGLVVLQPQLLFKAQVGGQPSILEVHIQDSPMGEGLCSKYWLSPLPLILDTAQI